MFDLSLFSQVHGRRAQELKPLAVAFADVVFRHQARMRATIPAGGNQPPLYAAECGVWQGESMLLCLRIAQSLGVPIHFFGLDTFTGLPDLSELDLAAAPAHVPYRDTRWFTDTSFNAVLTTLQKAGYADRVKLLPGLFSQTLTMLPDVKFGFVNIDCDLYEGHIECLDFFYQRMAPGGLIYFDDYHSVDFPMARQAIDSFLARHPELELIHMRFGDRKPNATKSMIAFR